MLKVCILLIAATMPTSALRKILVTGANKGIGKQICAKILSEVPDAHVLLGSRDAARGAAAVADLSAYEGRVEAVELDVTDESSVAKAAEGVDGPLYGIVNNAGVGFGRTIAETLAPNYYGAKRVCAHFLPKLDQEVGRVVNIASASGPNFVSRLDDAALFTSPETTIADLEAALEAYAASPDYEGVAYGLSKASLHVLSMNLAREHPNLKINSCSPGYILTDLTAGMGASKRPEDSNCHVAPLFLLFDEGVPTPPGEAWYYGSDAVRSPLDRYRDPGTPPYRGD